MAEPSERDVQALARRIAAAGAAERVRVFHLGWWSERMLDWALAHPEFKTQLFRFVDVFPALRSDAEVLRHIEEYFSGVEVPRALGLGLEVADHVPFGAHLTAAVARRNITRMARQLIAGSGPREALPRLARLWRRGEACSVDLLGEKTVTEPEADAYAARVAAMLEALIGATATWPPQPQLEHDPWGAVPRANVSVKPTALSPQFGPLTAAAGLAEARRRLRPLLARAREAGATIHLDMEHDDVKDLTLELLRDLGAEFPDGPQLGCVIQAYRKDASDDLAAIIAWSGRALRVPLQVRLVKGAYWDFETVVARADGWPVPVFERKAATDASFERCARLLVEHAGTVRPAFGSHNVRSLAYAIACARASGLPDEAIELQLLYGMAEPVHAALTELGLRVRVYAPVGELVPGMAYLVRRLLENTSNESFIRHRYAEGKELDELIAPPTGDADRAAAPGRGGEAAGGVSAPGDASRGAGAATAAPVSFAARLTGASTPPAASPPGSGLAPGDASQLAAAPTASHVPSAQRLTGAPTLPAASPPGDDRLVPRSAATAIRSFRNEPHAELRRVQGRARLAVAVESMTSRFGFEAPVLIDGRRVTTAGTIASVDPGAFATTVCTSGRAGVVEAERAIEVACATFPVWAATSWAERAAVLFRAAAIMRRRRDELAALEVFEAGKPQKEADADVCEAIDFCEYYGREALRLGAGVPPAGIPLLQPPGETNVYHWQPRGVAVVISPWNFPLAIPAGMVTAALVTGNCVVFKPAEQTPGIALRLVEILLEAGAPPGALAFVPGIGEEVGPALVDHPAVACILFTGSKPVGLSIIERAAVTHPDQRHVKRVVAEMGGKNAIIVDSDADLDQAVPAIVASAFDYAGQKCSAASRLIVLAPIFDELLERLVGATALVPVGHTRALDTVVGPLIDEDAWRRVRDYQGIAAAEGDVVYRRDDVPGGGWYVGPMIAVTRNPQARIATEEIFGPLLTVMRADDFEHALALANDTAYALTGGVFSRSPSRIRRAAEAFRAGNLYINRAITGARVGRQPFGGYGLSGVGSKTGGPDYLLELVDPRVVTENTIRQGFAPLER